MELDMIMIPLVERTTADCTLYGLLSLLSGELRKLLNSVFLDALI